MSALRAVQKAIKATIDAASVGAEFYDGAPASATFPYMELGSVSFFSDDADCVVGRQVTMQIDVWGRDQGKMHPTEAIVDSVYEAIHEADLTLDNPYAAVDCRVELVRIFPDPDGVTTHGVIQVTVLVEDRT